MYMCMYCHVLCVWLQDGVWIGIHRSELHVIIVSLLTSTIHVSPQYPLSLFPARSVFNSHSLATALTVEILQLPAVMSLLSGEYPATELLSTVNTTIAPSLLSLACKSSIELPTLNWTLSLTNHFTSLHFTQWTANLIVLKIAPWRGPHRKHRSSIVARVRISGNVFTESLLRNGLHNPVVLLLHACMLPVLPSNGRCLQSHRLATGL
jgi:hypothetical protein